MDKASLYDKGPQLLEYVATSGYTKYYLRDFKAGIEFVLENASLEDVSSYADIYRKYEMTESSPRKLSSMRYFIKSVEVYVNEGKYPDGTRNSPLIHRSSYYMLNEKYRTIIDYFIWLCVTREDNANSVKVRVSGVASFFHSLQKLGIAELSYASESNVLSHFVSGKGYVSRGYASKARIAYFLEMCMVDFPECERIMTFLPVFKRKRKNIQYLTVEEIDKVKCAICDENSGLNLRDRAMATLAIYTGLRSSDISNLRISNIDWDKDVLLIPQQKTGVPLTLDLSAHVGNAIWDYIELERPKTDSDYVFISKWNPYNGLINQFLNKRIHNVQKSLNNFQEKFY